MSVVFVSHVDRPEIADTKELWREWPEFMLHDDTAAGRWGRLYDDHAEFQLWGIDEATDELLVKVNGAPVALAPSSLPYRGWSEALRSAIDDDVEPALLCAFQMHHRLQERMQT